MLNLLLDLDPTVDLEDGRVFNIINRANWVEVMKCSHALADETTEHETKVLSVLTMFYEELTIDNIFDYSDVLEELILSMYWFISYGDVSKQEDVNKKPMLNFEKDIRLILEGISQNHGEIRGQYLHWWTFLDYFHGIKDSTFNTVQAIRWKQANHKKLADHEKEFLKHNRELVKI